MKTATYLRVVALGQGTTGVIVVSLFNIHKFEI
jgi:hypothetical protein